VPSFLIALCQHGAEAALKAEAARVGLHASFQRPGFVTLKRATETTIDDLATAPPLVFARHLALSLGKIDGSLADVVKQLAATKARCLHVVAGHSGDDSDASRARDAEADALRAKILAQRSDAFRAGEDAEGDELVATLILVDGDRWLSLHRASAARTPFSGGRPRLLLPDDAPSRAWLKLEEAARLFRIPFAVGERAVELGSAPGGAARALLDRGLEVVGVDPGDMDARVAAHPRFAHIKSTSPSVDPRRLQPIQWLLLDVNVPPRTALRGALPFVAVHAATLQGFVFTMKMKDWSLASEVDDWLASIRAAAPDFAVEARQLWSNGREICVVGGLSV
jgi:23S rRNA (cytidine2498-2'-O)-methyltransferase